MGGLLLLFVVKRLSVKGSGNIDERVSRGAKDIRISSILSADRNKTVIGCCSGISRQLFIFLSRAQLPHRISLIEYPPDSVIRNASRPRRGGHLHPSRLKLEYLLPRDHRSIAGSASVQVLHADPGKVEMGIVTEAQQEGVASSHFLAGRLDALIS
jgi:hypothetical protein